MDAAARAVNAQLIVVGDSQLLPYLNNYFRVTDESMPIERVVDAVVEFWTEGLDRLRSAGVADEAVILDFGPDFAKTPHQTLQCLREWERLAGFRRPLLMALSRKDFIGAITGRAPRERLAGTLAAIAHTLTLTRSGIYRVHDIQEVRNFLDVWDVLQGETELDPAKLLDPALWRAR